MEKMENLERSYILGKNEMITECDVPDSCYFYPNGKKVVYFDNDLNRHLYALRTPWNIIEFEEITQ